MKAVITSKEEFEALNPILQAEYTETNGLFVLNADGIKSHPEVRGLATALDSVKSKKTEATERLEELEAAKKAADEATLSEQQKFKELSDLKTTEAQKYADELKSLKDQVLQKEIDGHALKIATAINATDAKRQRFLADEARKYVKNTDNGLAFLNEDGTPTDQKTVIEKLTAEYPFLASGNPASGGGASGNTNPTTPTNQPKTAGEALTTAFKGVTA